MDHLFLKKKIALAEMNSTIRTTPTSELAGLPAPPAIVDVIRQWSGGQ
jgi:hypothetical protein